MGTYPITLSLIKDNNNKERERGERGERERERKREYITHLTVHACHSDLGWRITSEENLTLL